MLFDYHLLLLMSKPTDSEVTPIMMFNLGWSFIGVFVLFLFTNMSILVYNTVKGIYLKWNKKRILRKAKNLVPVYEKQIKFRIAVSKRLRNFARQQKIKRNLGKSQIDISAIVSEWNSNEFSDSKVMNSGLQTGAFRDKKEYFEIKSKV